MIELFKMQAEYKAKRLLDDDIAKQFVEAVENGLSVDAIVEIMCVTQKYKTIEPEIKRLVKNRIVRASPVFCASLGVRCLNQGDAL